MRTYERPVLPVSAIASVQQQTFRDREITIVNNGGDPAVVDRVVDAARRTTGSGTISVLHLAERTGMEDASNRGRRLSRWLPFQDGTPIGLADI